MTRTELARLLDHSVLKPEATEGDVRAGAAIVRTWRIGFYCVQPCWVTVAAAALSGADARVVSVVGFPHGGDHSDVKARAAALAVADGAGEIDMVINFGALKSGLAVLVAADIAAVVRAVPRVPVKVILETTALTDDEKNLACRLACDSGAAFVKTSTGFHPTGGATIADVRLLRAAVGPNVGVKASGGIRNLADALSMIEAGANRIGTSASAAILSALGSGQISYRVGQRED
jgi:deoxyribose-phosphate aldolase